MRDLHTACPAPPRFSRCWSGQPADEGITPRYTWFNGGRPVVVERFEREALGRLTHERFFKRASLERSVHVLPPCGSIGPRKFGELAKQLRHDSTLHHGTDGRLDVQVSAQSRF